MGYVVTLNREFGSLGRPIAKHMAEELGIEYYDRDIVEDTAKKMSLPVSTISDEEERSGGKFLSMKFPLGTAPSEIQDDIFRAQRDIILRLVERGSCIIVGRAADYILKDRRDLLRIYVYAPYQARFDNCVNELLMSPEAARKMIREVDRARNAYYRHYAGYKAGDPEHQDLLVNSAAFGAEGTARILCQVVRDRFGA